MTRDLVAGLVALFLIFVAFSLLAALDAHRRRRERLRREAVTRGRTIVAELPLGRDLTLVCEDPSHFYYGERTIDKADIRAVRLLVNGVPVVSSLSRRAPASDAAPAAGFEDRPEGIAHDRWDVVIETMNGTILVECGAIRERISQELAQKIFDAVRRDLEARDATTPPR